MALPTSAYTDFPQNFLGRGGLAALLGPLTGGNPLLGLGVKLLQGAVAGSAANRLQAFKAMPVSIVEVKDTRFDPYTLSQGRQAFQDQFGRRAIVARPMRHRR